MFEKFPHMFFQERQRDREKERHRDRERQAHRCTQTHTHRHTQTHIHIFYYGITKERTGKISRLEKKTPEAEIRKDPKPCIWYFFKAFLRFMVVFVRKSTNSSSRSSSAETPRISFFREERLENR